MTPAPLAFALLGPPLLLAAPLAGPDDEARVERAVAVMGTELRVEVEAASRAQALAASEAAVATVEAVEDCLSTWRESSELYRLNHAPLGDPFEPSPRLARVLERADYWRRETEGAFSPTLWPLVEAWGLREGGRRPSAADLERALEACAPEALELDLPAAVTRRRVGAGFEEGGFGKGAALDEAEKALRALGVRAFLDLGGQVLYLGGSSAREVRVAHPDQRDRAAFVLAIEAGSCATSGNSERGIEVEGERLGHLLDPRSGAPARDFGSVTVLAPSATDADCLSTALYVLGPDAALAFVHARPHFDAVVLERRGGDLRLRATWGLQGSLRPLLPGLEVEWFDPASSTPPPATKD